MEVFFYTQKFNNLHDISSTLSLDKITKYIKIYWYYRLNLPNISIPIPADTCECEQPLNCTTKHNLFESLIS